ncbi:MAG: lactam utilization protein B [Kangiellaceae bacterium]
MPITTKKSSTRDTFTMARALQNIMRKHQSKVKYTDRKGALLMALASNDHRAMAAVLQKWIRLYSPNIKTNLTAQRK